MFKSDLSIKKILKYILVLITGIISGMLLLILAYTLPTDIMRSNLKRSADTIEHEREYERIAASQLDNYTDSIMLANAVYDGGESLTEKAVRVFRKAADDKNPHDSLAELLNAPEQKYSKPEYSRYWHGYLIILKPLLLIFSYNDIRTVNTILIPLIILLICVLMHKSGKGEYIIPYAVSVILINPAAIMMSMHFSTVFYIYNLSMAFILYADIKHIKYDSMLFFLIVGMAAAYFDFLTYPLASFGMPMITLMILNNRAELSVKIKSIFKSGVFWVTGYIGMWVGKWCTGSIILRENLFSKALEFVEMRTSDTVYFTDKSLSFIDSVFSNLKIIFANRVYPVFIIMVLIYFFIRMKKAKVRFNAEMLKSLLPFFLVSVMPFIWYSLTINHSSIHCWFTYRALSVTVYGGLSILPELEEQYVYRRNQI